MSYVQGSTGASLRMSNVPIPNAPTLAGVSFYTQNLALDLGGASPELFPSLAMKWLIGTGNPLPASRVHGIGSSLSTTGTVTQSNAAVLQFIY